MERYEKYKDSGIAWLGEIPEHWETKKLKYVGLFINGFSFNSKDFRKFGVKVLKISNIQNMTIDWSDSVFLDDDFYTTHSNFRVHKNDLVFALTRPIISTGIKVAFVDTNEKILLNQRNAIFRTKSAEIKWIYFILLSQKFISEFDKQIDKTGQQPNISSNEIGDISISIPPIKEQRTIAAFLDRKTAEIDELIAQKERLIALYEEEKTAIINEAVTKGINPDVKLKPTAIDWLGDIPEHWKQIPFRWCCYITEGQVDPTNSQFRQLPLIAPNHIESKTGKLIQKETAEEQGAISGKYFYKSGTLLYSKIRPALVKACIADEDGLCSADMYPILTKNNLLPKFMLYQILSKGFTQLAILVSDRVAMPKLNRDTLGDFSILVPPLEEQKAIAEYIEKETARIDAKIAKTKRIIELQKEYRTALISEAVTGKIKIPDLTEPKP
jgi:type I restriction enzyme S subunit